MGTKARGRELRKNVKDIEAVKPGTRRVSYSIKGERGLRLVVHPSGRKVWFSVYQIGKGKTRERRWHEIGPFNKVGLRDEKVFTLEEACTLSRKHQVEAAKGGDPQSAKTFGQLFHLWLEKHAKKKLATWKDEERRYNMYLATSLGERLFAEIERKDVGEVRDAVAEKPSRGGKKKGRPIQSNRVVALFNRVANFAVDEGLAKFNPANRLRKSGQEQRRERVLSSDELSRVWAELDAPISVEWGKTRNGEKYEDGEERAKGGLTEADLKAAVAVRRALKLLILTGQRRGEVIGMRKDELDLTEGDAWWTLPGSRSKNKLPHRVPLTDMAVAVVREAIEASGASDFVFPSHRTKEAIIPDAVTKALQRLCRRMKPKIEGLGPHDIRRTVGTTMRKLGVSVEDRGYVFNHISGAKAKVTSWNYDAGEHDDEKRAALEKWERELKRVVGIEGAKIIPMQKRA